MRSTCAARQRRGAALMIAIGALRLDPQVRHAGVGHDVHAGRQPGVGILVHQHAQLHVEEAVGARDVFEVRGRARPAEHRDRGRRRCAGRRPGRDSRPVGSRTTSIANSGVTPAGGHAMADAKQAAVEQQRVRAGLILRQAGIVRPVDGREDRILAAGGAPALADRLHRDAHRVRGLVAGHARASVGADRLEEGMALGLDRTARRSARPGGRGRWRTPGRAAASTPLPGSIHEVCGCAGVPRRTRPGRRGMPPRWYATRPSVRARSTHAPAILAPVCRPQRQAVVHTRGVARPSIARAALIQGTGSALSPGARPCIFASTGGSMAAASSRFRIITFASALALFAGPAAAQQIDLAGMWSSTRGNHEELPLRGDPGVEVGEYVGIPLTDGARQHAESWTPTMHSLLEWQGRPHPVTYAMRAPRPGLPDGPGGRSADRAADRLHHHQPVRPRGPDHLAGRAAASVEVRRAPVAGVLDRRMGGRRAEGHHHAHQVQLRAPQRHPAQPLRRDDGVLLAARGPADAGHHHRGSDLPDRAARAHLDVPVGPEPDDSAADCPSRSPRSCRRSSAGEVPAYPLGTKHHDYAEVEAHARSRRRRAARTRCIPNT